MYWDNSNITSFLFQVQPVIVLVFALLLDKYLGEPRYLHPLVGFGHVAHRIEKRLYAGDSTTNGQCRLRGIFAVLLAVCPFVLLVSVFRFEFAFQMVLEIVIVYLAVGANSLELHARKILVPLQNNQLNSARHNVGMIVSRDTSQMTQTAIIRATVESVLENGNDAVFAALFWYLLAGIPGIITYRLVNTLDAMWGYRNQRYQYFGWAAARFDDLLNWLPARLCALTYALLGNRQSALQSWQKQASKWDSPNAGPVIASGAGALGITLGGEAVYGNKVHQRPIVGSGPDPKIGDIVKAIDLVNKSIMIWLIFSLIGYWYFA